MSQGTCTSFGTSPSRVIGIDVNTESHQGTIMSMVLSQGVPEFAAVTQRALGQGMA